MDRPLSPFALPTICRVPRVLAIGCLTIGLAAPSLSQVVPAPLPPTTSVVAVPAPAPPSAFPANRQESVILSAQTVLQEIMAIPASGIPASMLADAHGVAIIPNVIQGGFVVGARHGRGVLMVRDPNGLWHAPAFITLTGGNIGWQAGVRSTDVILVFRSRRSVEGIMNGKFTIGADASAAAGPVGRQAGAATDASLRAEILSYSRSRGLFAGVALDGSMLQIDSFATASFYSTRGPGGEVVIPESARNLTLQVAALTGSSDLVETPQPAQRPISLEVAGKNSDSLQRQLEQAAIPLFELLDDAWRSHLAMPPEIFHHSGHPDPAALQAVLDRFNFVASNPDFRALASQPQFQATHALLKQYVASLSETPAPLQLPPPPG